MNESTGWQLATMPQSQPHPDAQRRREFYQLGLILLLALIHGMIFIFLVPPWQHYDEPNHFEHVWLTARLDRLPQPGDGNPKLSRRVLQSMLENGFYHGVEWQPALPAAGEKAPIPGYSQLGEPRLYYLLASLPLRLLSPAVAIEKQLYAARMISLALYLLTVLAGWGAARVLAPPGHALRWLAPATLALLPGFADLMTAVNNDVAAVALFSLFFWGSLRLVCQPFLLLNLLWVLVTAGLAYFTKNTAMIALVVLPLVLLFAFVPGRWHRLVWAALGVGVVIALVIGVQWHDAGAWHRGTPQAKPLRIVSNAAVAGTHVLALSSEGQAQRTWLPPVYQVLPPQSAGEIYGKDVTLGAWMWADRPVAASFPTLKYSKDQIATQAIELTTQPQFFAVQVSLPAGSDRIWVFLDPLRPGDGQAQIYYDGLVLADGRRPLDQSPQFNSADGSAGEWGGQPFVNRLRNPSFEAAGPRLIAWLDNPATGVLPDNARPSQVLASLWDWSGTGYFYTIIARHLFQTFWARFGWGHVPLAWLWVYTLLAGLTLLGVGGAVWGAWRLRRDFPWPAVAIGGVALLAAWALALVRGAVYLPLPGYYYPTARHAYPAILPAVLGLTFGWWQWMRWSRWLVGLYLVLFALLAVLSVWSVVKNYGLL